MRDTVSSHPPLIAHVIFRLGTGGLENGLVNLINNIPADKYSHAVICMTDYTHFRERLVRRDVEVYCLHKKPGQDVMVYFRLWKLLLKIKPDILHTRNLSALEAQLPGFLAGIKCRIHGEHGRDIDDVDGTNVKHTLLRRFFRLLVQRYVPMSKDLERWLIGHIKVDQKRITQIYNGVDVDKFKPAEQKNYLMLPESFRDQGLAIIGTVGRQEKVKDPMTLLQAFVHSVKNNPLRAANTRLVLVGDGSLSGLLKALAEQEGVADLVWFAGDRSDVSELMQAFDIFVLPSLNEGISNTILEAMATGLPIVATQVGGNPELVGDQQNGYLVPKQDPAAMAGAIGLYVDNPAIRREHGQNSRKRCQELFSLRRMVSDYTNVYDQLIKDYG